MPRSSSKDQDASSSASSVSASSAEDEEGTAAQSTTTADRSSAEQQAGPPSGTTAPSALTSADVPGPSDITIPKGGLEAMRERLGADLNEYGAELARRVLGELHIHRSGGVPASQIALEGADQLESEDAAWWNEKGQELAEKDFVGLNQRGSFSAPLPAEPAPPPSAEPDVPAPGQTQTQTQTQTQREEQAAGASSLAPQTGPAGGPPAPPTDQEAP